MLPFRQLRAGYTTGGHSSLALKGQGFLTVLIKFLVMLKLKEIFYSEYGGFADKRIKHLNKGHKFIVDDRSPCDVGADKRLYSYFCMIFADVESETEVKISLIGNIPINSDVTQWINNHRAELNSESDILSFIVYKGNEDVLMELADFIAAIVAPGAKRYTVPSYKYVCPRTAGSLRRLAMILKKAWK